MSYFRSGDPLEDFNRLDTKQSRWLAKRPVCRVCHEHIQTETGICIEGSWICEHCIKDHREYIEDDD